MQETRVCSPCRKTKKAAVVSKWLKLCFKLGMSGYEGAFTR
jgi:hypothetical protein